jgi:hypothetical protein
MGAVVVNMKIIAICGYKRSGKDTIANYIQSKLSNSLHCKISTNLKEGCAAMFGFTAAHMETDLKEVIDPFWNITPRQAMQYLGTDVMQYDVHRLIPDINRDFWIKRFIHQIKTSSDHTKKCIIISDLRFTHEYIALKEHFGDNNCIVIKVTRGSNSHEDMHPSEQEWKQISYDIEIKNKGSLDDLYKDIDNNVLKCVTPHTTPESVTPHLVK